MASDPVEGAKANPVADLAQRMTKADWFCDYSDDAEVRMRGNKELGAIFADLKTLQQIDPQAVHDLWQDYAPKESTKPRYLVTPEEMKAEEDAWKTFEEALDELYPESKKNEPQPARDQQSSSGREP